MGKLLICGLLICAVCIPSHAQRQPKGTSPNSGRISKQLPSVYITLERHGQNSSSDNVAPEERAWLRLHNNTRWAIWFKMQALATKKDGDGGLFYDVENLKTNEIKIGRRCHACSIVPLSPGHSFLFSIPAADLEKDSRIRINFWWAWQDHDDVFGSREVESWVYFYTPA